MGCCNTSLQAGLELDRSTEEEAVDVDALRERLQQVGFDLMHFQARFGFGRGRHHGEASAGSLVCGSWAGT